MRWLILAVTLSGCAHMVVGSKPDYTHYAATALEAVGCAGLTYVQSVKRDNQANKTVLFFVDEVCLTSLFLDIAFEKVERQ
jgi:hypothetical protein